MPSPRRYSSHLSEMKAGPLSDKTSLGTPNTAIHCCIAATATPAVSPFVGIAILKPVTVSDITRTWSLPLGEGAIVAKSTHIRSLGDLSAAIAPVIGFLGCLAGLLCRQALQFRTISSTDFFIPFHTNRLVRMFIVPSTPGCPSQWNFCTSSFCWSLGITMRQPFCRTPASVTCRWSLFQRPFFTAPVRRICFLTCLSSESRSCASFQFVSLSTLAISSRLRQSAALFSSPGV